MKRILTRIRSWFERKPELRITFTSETLESRKQALSKPWWKDPHADLAKQLIRDEAIRRGKPSPFATDEMGYHTGPYGSGWFIELPRYVAILITEQGMEEAVEYVRWTFEQGSMQDAFDKLLERNPNENFCVAYYG